MAKFFKELTRRAIEKIEFEDPFKDIRLFNLIGVESRALTLDDVPQEYRPYEGCLFDVLSEPDNDLRLEKLKEFFKVLASEGDPGRDCGLMYTVMQIWRLIYSLAMYDPPNFDCLKSIEYFLGAGMVAGYLRILRYCLTKEFCLIEYNRYVPYRILETFFAATQTDMTDNNHFVEMLVEDEQQAYDLFMPLLDGKITWVEQISCGQVVGNMSCYPRGVIWLLDHPHAVGALGKFLWGSYELMYVNYRQYEDRKLLYHKALLNTEIDVIPGTEGNRYLPSPTRVADLTTFVTLCALCNVCAAHPEELMERVEPSLVQLVRQGIHWNMGTVCFGIVLNESKYTDLSLEKFLSLFSWCCFSKEAQQGVVKQMKLFPRTRFDDPLLYSRTARTISGTVLACLVTHALWLDYEKGSHFAVLGLISLLTVDDRVAMEVIRVAGTQLVDLAHSIHHVQMPGDIDPTALKRGLLEPLLRLGGSRFFTERGIKSRPAFNQFDEPPPCVQEAREYCRRYTKEVKMKKVEKRKAVRAADLFKTEGNEFFSKGEFLAAIECYSRALDTCPLTCTERRVTYHSNRAECYLKINHPRKAIRDCNRALAMNPYNLKARWRRAQAYQNIDRGYPAALDLLTIRRKEEQAKEILGEQVYEGLDEMICENMDYGTFMEMAIKKYGDVVYSGSLARGGGTNKDTAKDKTKLPPCRGKNYQEVFGSYKSWY